MSTFIFLIGFVAIYYLTFIDSTNQQRGMPYTKEEFTTFRDQIKVNGTFFIYEWSDLVNRYANFTDRDHGHHGVEFPQWKYHYGAGRILNASLYEHKTSQFSLFKLMYERALLDPRRVHDPELADSFLIPYDYGMDASFFETNGRMRRTNCPQANEVVRRLKESKYFLRKNGHDHTLIVSINQNMNYFFGAKNCLEMSLLCWNVTKLCIDEYMFIAADRDYELKHRGINWHAVPFPSDYHYSSSINSALPWDMKSNLERPFVISFTGNPRRFNEIATQIREALLIQCDKHPTFCFNSTYRHDGKVSPNQMSRKSIFCLQPPGDMPTRKSLFDSILSGCIPVLFHPLTARFMYEWHLGQDIWEDIGLHYDTIDEINGLISQKIDFIQEIYNLYKNNPSLVRMKQQKIEQIAFRLQYTLIEEDASNNPFVAMPLGKIDAYELSIRKILDLHTGRSSHNRTSEYLRCHYLHDHKGSKIQTADWCNRTYSLEDPFSPPSVSSPLFKNIMK